LYLGPSMVAGGAERCVVEHLKRLSRERFRVELGLFAPDGPLRAEVPDDVPVHHVRGGRPSNLLARTWSLRRLIADRGYDLVVSHLAEADTISLRALRRRSRGVPRVCFIHFDVAGRRLRATRMRVQKRLARRLYGRAHRIVCLTRRTADWIAEACAVEAERIRVIPNGLDHQGVRALAGEPPPAWPAPGLRLLALGRLVGQKGFDILLDAFARARARGLEASLLVLGEGERRRELERQAGELQVRDVVSLPGHAANPYPALRAADAFVLSSRWEGFGLVVLEAMALGTPVVSTDCRSGPREILDGTGLLVPPEDPGALADALLEIAADPERRARLAEQARARSLDFDWDAILPQIEEVYLEAAAR